MKAGLHIFEISFQCTMVFFTECCLLSHFGVKRIGESREIGYGEKIWILQDDRQAWTCR